MKVALYARVSTEKQELQNTIESQISELEIIIQQNGDSLIESFIDNGYSGTLLARPALDKLRDEIKNKSFEKVYIHSPDRLARKYAYQVLILDEFKKYGVEICFKNSKSAETPEEEMLLGLQGIVAEYEKVKIVERTRRGRLFRAKSNHVIGNIPPYGYDCIPKNQSNTGFAEYKINESEAEIVRSILKWLIEEQLTTYKIVERLRSRGLKGRGGKLWVKSSVHKILRNETYCGITHYNKHYQIASNKEQEKGKYTRREHTLLRLRPKDEWIPITVPAIIDREIFEAAQIQLKQNALFADRNTKHHYMLRGIIKCGNEQGSMYGVPNHGVRYYRCNFKSKLVGDTQCGSSIVKADVIESIVWESITKLLSDPQLIKKQYENWVRKIEIESNFNYSDISKKNLEQKLLILKNRENRLLQAFNNGAISIDQLKEQNHAILREKNDLQKKEAEMQNLRKSNTFNKPKIKDFENYADRFSSLITNLDPTQKQTVLRKAQTKITVQDRKITIVGAIPQGITAVLHPQSPFKRSSRRRKDAHVARISFYITRHG